MCPRKTKHILSVYICSSACTLPSAAFSQAACPPHLAIIISYRKATNVTRSTAASAVAAAPAPVLPLLVAAAPSILRARWHVLLTSESRVSAMKAVCCERKGGARVQAVGLGRLERELLIVGRGAPPRRL